MRLFTPKPMYTRTFGIRRPSVARLGYGLALLATVFSCRTVEPPAPRPLAFTKHTLTTDFVSEGIAAADVNRDGKTDLLAGSFWFKAPEWDRHEIDTPRVFPVVEGILETIEASYSNSMVNFAMDVNLDGWTDFIRIDFPGTAAYWYENPRNGAGYWKRYTIFETVGNESPRLVDIDGDGRPDLLFGDASTNQMIWMRAPRSEGAVEWEKFVIASDSVPGTKRFAHGLGYGDISGDGRADVIITDGWWEGPDDVTQPDWKFHATSLGQACAHMEPFDVDGDGDQDVLTSSAHKRGIWWQEQIDPEHWKEHTITSAYSQTHVLELKDLNGDGRPEMITGKRYLASRGRGEGAHEPAVVLVLEYTNPEKREWTVREIDNDSGVGLNIVVDDINGDGLPDIATANKKGVFFFEQQGDGGTPAVNVGEKKKD